MEIYLDGNILTIFKHSGSLHELFQNNSLGCFFSICINVDLLRNASDNETGSFGEHYFQVELEDI